MAQLNSLLVTGDSRFLNPINGNARNGIYYVKGTQTAATGAWTGNIPVPALYDGLTICYYLPYAGSGNATLNLTLSTGATTGAKNCYYNTGRLTTHYSKGQNVFMTYHPAGSISVDGVATSDDRWVVAAEYADGNNTYDLTNYYNRFKAGANKVFPYTIIMQCSDGRWESIVTSSSTGTSKARNTHGFRLGQIAVMYANATYAENATIGDNTIYEARTSLIDHRYSFNTANDSTNGTTAVKPVYLVGTLNASDGLFYLDTTWWTQTLPSSEDGKLYIYLGDAYDYYRMTFRIHHPIYHYLNGMIREYTQSATTTVAQRQKDSGNVNFPVLFANDNVSIETDQVNAVFKSKKVYINPETGNLVTTQLNGTTIGNSPQFTDKYHTTGSWSNFKYTATAQGGAEELSFTLPTGTSASQVSVGNHTHGNIQSGGALQTNDVTIASGDKLVITDSSDSSKVARASVSFDGSTTTKALTQKGTFETFAASSHTHGNVQNGGTLQTNDITIATGDKLVVTDSSDSNKIARTSVSFDGSTATKCLTQKGTWENFTNNSGTVTGTGTSGYLTKWNGTNSITNGPQLGSGTTTYLRNDGSWQTPPNDNNAVTQTITDSTNSSFKLLMSGTADNITRTEGARKSTHLSYNPSENCLNVVDGTVECHTVNCQDALTPLDVSGEYNSLANLNSIWWMASKTDNPPSVGNANTTLTSVTFPAGLWLIIGAGYFDSNSTGTRWLFATTDGTANGGIGQAVNIAARVSTPAANIGTGLNMNFLYDTEGNTKLYFKARQNSGTNLGCQYQFFAVRLNNRISPSGFIN